MSEAPSTNSEVRIGVLGNGWMGTVHAECYRRIKGAKVVGIFSRNQERAETAAKTCDAKAVVDPSALLDDPKVDAIDVCLPTANHAEFVVAALEHGKHVFCETPFALTFTEAEAMLKAAKDANRIFMVGLLERSVAQYEYVHQAALAGHLGKVLSITTYRLGSYLLSEESRRHYADRRAENRIEIRRLRRFLFGILASGWCRKDSVPSRVAGAPGSKPWAKAITALR